MRFKKLAAMTVFRCTLMLLAILLVGHACSLADTLILPAGIVTVDKEAFMDDTNVTELVIQEGAETIGAKAFANTGLTKVTFPSTLTFINDDAFDGCSITEAYAPADSAAFEYCLAKGWPVTAPWTPAMSIAAYRGVPFKIVNTKIDPVSYSRLTYQKCCQAPNAEGISEYGDLCLNFSYYYVHCMLDGVTELSLHDASRGVTGGNRFTTENFGSSDKMMARLHDVLNTGSPQILMVEALTHPGRRHFLTVVGYRASVIGRDNLRPEDLLLIDTFDGKLESMDPAIEPTDTRVLFKQDGLYRIVVTKPK